MIARSINDMVIRTNTALIITHDIGRDLPIYQYLNLKFNLRAALTQMIG
jgi:hypothetical protein